MRYMTRREAREQAFIIMFEKCFRKDETMREIIDTAIEDEMITEDDYSFYVLKTADENIDSIDEKIIKYCRGWALERIPKVCLSILRVAVAEMLYIESVPVNVSVNEAVELTKKYGEKNDSSFVNGILGSISREKNSDE